MKKSSSILILPAAALAVLAVGCANPAADAPQAEVADAPAAAPAEEPAAGVTTWPITDESTIGFVGSKVTGSHDGGFEQFEGTVELTGDTPESAKVNLTIDMTSVWTDAEKLTGHLKSADFFEVETYPTSTFTTTSIAAVAPAEGEEASDAYSVTGVLNLHGVEKQITFPATITMNESQLKANAEFAIQRFDFGIEYKGAADDLIRDDVLIKLDVTAAPAMADAGADMGEESMDGGEAMDEESTGDEAAADDSAADAG